MTKGYIFKSLPLAMVWAHDPVADPRFPSLSLGKNLLFGKIFAKKTPRK